MDKANALLGTRTDFAMHFAAHQVLVCTTCRYKDSACTPGLDLIAQLQKAMMGVGLTDDFEVFGTACMAGCDRPCTVAWMASGKATYLFGNIVPGSDISDLVVFAKLYQRLDDGWCNAGDRPGKLAHTTLARIPSALAGMSPQGHVRLRI